MLGYINVRQVAEQAQYLFPISKISTRKLADNERVYEDFFVMEQSLKS